MSNIEEFDFQADDNVHNHTFTIIYNSTIESDLSPTAFRLITYMCSKPKGWKFHMYKLQEVCQCGKNKLYEAFKELKDAGYLKTVAIRDGKEFKGSVRVFSNRPIYKSMEFPDFGSSINRKSHKPGVEVSNTERVNNTESSSKTHARAPATLNTKEIEPTKAFVAAVVLGEKEKGQGQFNYVSDSEELIQDLAKIDISNQRATMLIAKYGTERIREALNMTHFKARTNPAAYFEQILANGWKPSTGRGLQEAPSDEHKANQIALEEQKRREEWEAGERRKAAAQANPIALQSRISGLRSAMKQAKVSAMTSH